MYKITHLWHSILTPETKTSILESKSRKDIYSNKKGVKIISQFFWGTFRKICTHILPKKEQKEIKIYYTITALYYTST